MRVTSAQEQRLPRLTAAVLAALLGVQCARAETSAAAAEPSSLEALEQVIVTAQRRPEDLQHVPVAVTALSGEELWRRQISELSELQYAVPNLAIYPVVGNSMTATISLRGQFEPDLVPTVDPAVATYLDGVYIARTTGANLDLVDVERAEVLRGPQGTLFGRNALGGAISVTSRKPTRDSEVRLSGEFGNYDSKEVEGVLNLPLAHAAAVRIAAAHTSHDSYGRAVLLDRPLSDDDTNYVRTTLRIWPAEEWTLDLAGDLTSAHTDSQLMTFLAGYGEANDIPAANGHPEDALSNYAGVTDGDVMSNRAGGFSARVWGTSATLSGSLGAASLTSITAFRRLDLNITDTDFDGTPYDLFGLVSRDQSEHQFSEEIQLNGTSADARSRWTAGALYFSEYGALFQQNANLVPLTLAQNLTRGIAQNQSAAAWLQLAQALTSRVNLTAGLRYNVDWRRLTSRNAALEPDGTVSCRLDPSIRDAPDVCQASLPQHRFAYVPFTAGLDFTPAPSQFLYAKVSRGYRAGGFNMRGGTPVEFLTFSPENVTAYEIGLKSDLARKLRVDLALFYSDFRDIQLGESVPDPLQGVTFITQNGGRARLAGGELELTALLGPLRLAGALGITDGRYLELPPNAGLSLDAGLGLPKTTASLAADLPLRTSRGELVLHADYAWRSDDGDADSLSRCHCRNAYGLLNARVTFNVAGTPLQWGIWGRNLTDTHYLAQWVDFDYLINAIPGEPRTFGVSVSYAVPAH